jgi:hypothetical protein
MPPRQAKPGQSDRSGARAVLVVGTDDWAIEQATDQLTAAGMRVLTCHPSGQPAFPCNALVEGRTCPLDVGFDVVVDVRARPEAMPTQGEMGVICALHAEVPLVTAGIAGRNPFASWAVRALGKNDDLAAAVEDTVPESEFARANHAKHLDLRESPVTPGEKS